MNVSFAQSAAALNANSRWQELIAENLASSAIPGFKKHDLSFSAVQAGYLPGAHGVSKSFLLPHAGAVINFLDGEQKFTGVKTDLALEGPGFLAVQMPDGATAYTRDGELRVDSSGRLVTKQGYSVLGVSGPLQLDPSNPGELSISLAGEVSQGRDSVGTLRAVGFNDLQLLTPISRGLFLGNHPDLLAQDSTQTNFRQGFLEAANTSAPAEMSQLIAAMRIYEANQRALQAHDARMGQAITQLAGGG